MRSILRFRGVHALVGLSRSTVDRLEQAGKFPRRVPLTEAAVPRVGWYEDEIEEWIESRRNG